MIIIIMSSLKTTGCPDEPTDSKQAAINRSRVPKSVKLIKQVQNRKRLILVQVKS